MSPKLHEHNLFIMNTVSCYCYHIFNFKFEFEFKMRDGQTFDGEQLNVKPPDDEL